MSRWGNHDPSSISPLRGGKSIYLDLAPLIVLTRWYLVLALALASDFSILSHVLYELIHYYLNCYSIPLLFFPSSIPSVSFLV